MQTEINLLPDHLINQIAAGEVIENPASVIKELVENSLDAKATKIEVEIKAGGLLFIRVSDDGIGMSKKNLKMSLLRHATSKITSFEDLQKVRTMGFRGEALASIASISKMRIESAQEGEAHALFSDGGNEETIEPCSRILGTQVEIKSLFFNVPVRKKFQKSTISLTNEILKAVNNLVMANPFIGFTFISDGRKIIDVKRSENVSFKEALEIRVKAVLGENIFNYLSWVEEKEDPFHIHGFIASPLFSKRNRSGQYLFLNGRSVFSEVISRAIKEGYSTRIDEKDFPVYILHIETDPDLLDVNVHPQKKYVRISEEQAMRSYIQRAINASFIKKNAQASFDASLQFFREEKLIDSNCLYGKETLLEMRNPETWFPETAVIENQSLFDKYRQQEIFSSFRNQEKSDKKNFKVAILSLIGNFCVVDPSTLDLDFFDRPTFDLKKSLENEKDPVVSLREKESCDREIRENGLFVIDLKAASATIFFEKIKKAIDKDSEAIEKQSFSFPILIEFMPEEISLIESNLDVLSKMGFDLRPIGDTTIAFDSIPMFLKVDDFNDYLNAILQELDLYGKSEAGAKLIEKKLAQKVCKVAKSRQNNYSMEEVAKLVEALVNCDDPFHDPLGENTIIKIDADDLSKLFASKKGEKCHI